MAIIIGNGDEPDLKQQIKDAKDALQEVIMGGGLDVGELALQGFLLATFAKAELNALKSVITVDAYAGVTADALDRATIAAIETAKQTLLGQISKPVLANAAEIAAVRRR